MKDRLILHSDLNNFYASVECALNPELRDVPLAVAGNPERRHGVVLAKNAIAKKAGVKTGDVIWEAEAKCPGLKIVPPHFDLYTRYSNRIFELYTRFTSQVEPFGPDECWLDCTGSTRLFGDGEEIAKRILAEVKKETFLTVSVGVSFSKPLAKLCSDAAEPDGYFTATRDDYREKLWKRDVGDLMMVGRKTVPTLNRLNIHTIGDLALADEKLLSSVLGVNGVKLKHAALGDDGDPVREYDKRRKTESVGHGMTAVKDLLDTEDVRAVICYLSEKIAARMIKYGVKGSGVHVDLRSFELKHASKQMKLSRPTLSSADIADAAFTMAMSLQREHAVPLRTISVSVFDLSPSDGAVQLSMFDEKQVKRESLEKAIDGIKRKYGRDTIKRANLIARDFIYDKDDDEDFLPFKR